MEIAEVRATAHSSPIDPMQERSFHGGVRRLHKRDAVIVRLETRDGEFGYAPAGASSSAMREFFENASQRSYADLVTERVAPAIQGRAIDGPGDIQQLVDELGLTRKLTAEVISALDIAYYDLKGRRTGEPIYELLRAELADSVGGSIPSASRRLPLYASAGMYMAPSGYARQASALTDWGFEGYKYRPGIGAEDDRRTVELVADAVGEAGFMLDAHTWWKLPEPYDRSDRDAIIDRAAERGATWLEEPVEPDDYEGYVSLKGRGVPLAGGESEPDPEGLLALAETGAVDYLQGDVRHHRGFTGCRMVAETVRESDVTFVPHHFGTLLGLVANAHLVAALPEAELLEYPVFEGDPAIDVEPDPGMYPFAFAFEVLEEAPHVADGVLEVPNGPGLGVTVDESALAAYPFQDGPWTDFVYD